MENASKALLIAASVAIGVLLLSLIIILTTTFRDVGREYNEKMELKKIQTFNTQFTKYEDIDLKAQDVMTLANLVKEWNNTGTNETITIKVKSSFGHDETVDYDFLEKNNWMVWVNGGTIDYPTYKMEIAEDKYPSGRIKEITIKEQ